MLKNNTKIIPGYESKAGEILNFPHHSKNLLIGQNFEPKLTSSLSLGKLDPIGTLGPAVGRMRWMGICRKEYKKPNIL
jgi:hypothetical protein